MDNNLPKNKLINNSNKLFVGDVNVIWQNYCYNMTAYMKSLLPEKAIKLLYDMNEKLLNFSFKLGLSKTKETGCNNRVKNLIYELCLKCTFTNDILQYYLSKKLDDNLKELLFHIILAFHNKLSNIEEAKHLLQLVNPLLIVINKKPDINNFIWFFLVLCYNTNNYRKIQDQFNECILNKLNLTVFLLLNINNIKIHTDFIFVDIKDFIRKGNNNNLPLLKIRDTSDTVEIDMINETNISIQNLNDLTIEIFNTLNYNEKIKITSMYYSCLL